MALGLHPCEALAQGRQSDTSSQYVVAQVVHCALEFVQALGASQTGSLGPLDRRRGQARAKVWGDGGRMQALGLHLGLQVGLHLRVHLRLSLRERSPGAPHTQGHQ